MVIPMRPDELGARIATDPQTGRPTGYVQICPVRLGDQKKSGVQESVYFFRYEATAIETNFLMKWMAEMTQIKGRIVGRTLYLDHPAILQSPLLYLRANNTGKNIQPIHFTEMEKRNLRRYLVEKDSFIFAQYIHPWGVTRARGAAAPMLATFREIILGAGGRELRPIPNDPPIWNQPFRLGGEPKTMDPQYGDRPIPMTGFALDGRLSVVMSYNHGSSERAGGLTEVDYSPAVLRMCVNFMFYAATHGKISDYKHYVPPSQRREVKVPLPKRAPQAAGISATGP